MNWIFWVVLFALLAIAVIFAAINALFSFAEDDSFWGCLLHGLSKVITDISIGLIIIMLPVLIMVNYLKPKPEDIMPAFVYEGPYVNMTYEEMSRSAEGIIRECTDDLSKSKKLETYFTRAYFYFYTRNYDLAKNDLLICYNNSDDWKYAFDLGVVCGYLLEYEDAIDYFEEALDKENIPIAERGVAMANLELIQSYLDKWIYELFG